MVLAQLSPGQSARIKHMNHLERTLRRKLMVMGLLPQTEVLFLRAAPLGDPL
ncbi:FeoA family protein, partial [Aeromonas salmonicida]